MFWDLKTQLRCQVSRCQVDWQNKTSSWSWLPATQLQNSPCGRHTLIYVWLKDFRIDLLIVLATTSNYNLYQYSSVLFLSMHASPLSTSMRSKGQSSCNPTSLKRAVECISELCRLALSEISWMHMHNGYQAAFSPTSSHGPGDVVCASRARHILRISLESGLVIEQAKCVEHTYLLASFPGRSHRQYFIASSMKWGAGRPGRSGHVRWCQVDKC